MQHLVKKRQKLNPKMIKPPQRMNVPWKGSKSHIQPHLRCSICTSIHNTPISNVRHNEWHNQPPPYFKQCMRCMWPQRAQNPIYLLIHLLEVISRRKSLIQNKTKVVNPGDNFDNVRPNQQRERWNINPAMTITWRFLGFSLRPFAAAHSCTRCKSKFNLSIHLWKSDTAQLW
jgi:Zn-finger protein